jgi:hypothetical protein
MAAMGTAVMMAAARAPVWTLSGIRVHKQGGGQEAHPVRGTGVNDTQTQSLSPMIFCEHSEQLRTRIDVDIPINDTGSLTT